MTIRLAKKGEARLLTALSLRSKAGWGYSPDFMRACEKELTVHEEALASVYVKELTDEVVGFYSLQRLSVDRVELTGLFVEPQRLRQGFGTGLLQDALRRARGAGYRSMIIQGDPHATAFYRSAGGVRVGDRESESIPGRMLPLFEFVL